LSVHHTYEEIPVKRMTWEYCRKKLQSISRNYSQELQSISRNRHAQLTTIVNRQVAEVVKVVSCNRDASEMFRNLLTTAIKDINARLMENFGVQNAPTSVKYIPSDSNSLSNARTKGRGECKVCINIMSLMYTCELQKSRRRRQAKSSSSSAMPVGIYDRTNTIVTSPPTTQPMHSQSCHMGVHISLVFSLY
jgi:hypothetical protein